MRQMRDPAPSRLAYRMNRLMLTPRFRTFLRYGLPVLIVASIGAFWASDTDRREDASDRIAELRRQIQERPEFMVRMMAVEDVTETVAVDIRSILAIDFPQSSFDLDLDAIRAAVETLDAVESAAVQIRGGGVLSIDVTERVPAIIWREAEGLSLLDRDGHRVSTVAMRSDRSDLPLIVGQGAHDAVPEALNLIALSAPIAPRLRGLLRVGERRWDLVLDRDQRIQLPESDPTTALKKVIALDGAQDLLARDIAAIDFRNPRRPVLRLTTGAIDAMTDIELTETRDTLR
ncbi:cell division protein FtsQ/DivIB [uncultured Boseongicola sp.]|uniref:cell division protein FtsQ/DivIB n=1 Tax=uncultured Boseongicola sp. TaxID=1648499 RepID=UPI002613211C|nr:cell division protein FtsQ/DivIB [uncultured Boseongicola sp.]